MEGSLEKIVLPKTPAITIKMHSSDSNCASVNCIKEKEDDGDDKEMKAYKNGHLSLC